MDSFIVINFSEAVSIFILNYSVYFSGTTVAYTYSPTSTTVLSSSCNTSAKTDDSVSPYVTTDASISSSSFKIYSNSLMMTLMLKN